MTHHPDDLLAAFALDALPADEAGAVAVHVRACEQCRVAVIRLHQVTQVLALAAPAPPPLSPDVRSGLLRAAQQTPQVLRRTPSVQCARTWFRTAVSSLAAAIILAFTSLGLGVSHLRLQQQIQTLQTQVHGLQTQQVFLTAALVAAQNGQQGDGRVYVVPGRTALLDVQHLPPPASGQVYEAWVITTAGPQAAGTFVTTPEGRGILQLTRLAAQGETIAITSEPLPGTTAPTGAVLLKGNAEPG